MRRTRTHVELYLIVIGVFLIGIALSGCGPTKTAELDQARAAYQQAESNPDVGQYAPVVLREARQSLQKAEAADDEGVQKHYSFIAERTAELAQVTAVQRKSEDQLEQLSKEQRDFILQVRAQEADRAQQEARQAKEQLQQLQTRSLEQEAQSAQERAQMLERELAGLRARPTELGTAITLSDVLFKTGSATLQPGSMITMDRVAQFLRNHPDQRIIIEGHTDSTGSEGFNMQLSQRRADAVAMALRSRGVGPERIITRGLGEGYPVANNDTQAGRQQNRRVDVTVMDQRAFGYYQEGQMPSQPMGVSPGMQQPAQPAPSQEMQSPQEPQYPQSQQPSSEGQQSGMPGESSSGSPAGEPSTQGQQTGQ